MNEVQYHLMMNHFPIIVPFIALLVLIGGFIFRSDMVKRTALALFIFAALSTFPAMFTGDKAEDMAQNLPEVTKEVIESHEETAEQFALINYGLGILALAGLWASWKNHRFANLLIFSVIVLSLASIYYARKAGTSGGEIRHTEIRVGFEAENNSGRR